MIVSNIDEVYIISKNRIKICRGLLKPKSYVNIDYPASKLFRIGEEKFLVTSEKETKALEIKDSKVKELKIKDLITNDRTILAYKSNAGILQVTTQVINLFQKNQIILSEEINHACLLGSFIILASHYHLIIYKNFEILKKLDMEEEILSISDTNDSIIAAVKHRGLKKLLLSTLTVSNYEEFFPVIPNFYFSWNKYEIAGSGTKIYIKNESITILEAAVFRASLIKESRNSTEILLEGIESSYILTLPQIYLQKIRVFDCITLYDNTYFIANGSKCEIAELKKDVDCEKYEICEDILNLAPTATGYYVFTSENLILCSKSFQEILKVKIDSLDRVFTSVIIDQTLIFSCEIKGRFYLNSINLGDMNLIKSVECENYVFKIEAYGEILVLRYLNKIELTNLSFSLLTDLRFPSHEYDEISKKLETNELDALIDMKIGDYLQSIIAFFLLSSKEFLSVTTNNCYWGIIDQPYKVLSSIVLFI
jgi:hypothetical protein